MAKTCLYFLFAYALMMLLEEACTDNNSEIKWKKDVICKESEAIKHVKYKNKRNGNKVFYFGCDEHETNRTRCKNDDKTSHRFHKKRSWMKKTMEKRCGKVNSNVTSEQRYENSSLTPDEISCVWRNACIANTSHQEFARGVRSSSAVTVDQIQFYCCLVNCLRDCGTEHILNGSKTVSNTTVITKIHDPNTLKLDTCVDCSFEVVPALIIAPCCHLSNPAGTITDVHRFNTYYYTTGGFTICYGEYAKTFCDCGFVNYPYNYPYYYYQVYLCEYSRLYHVYPRKPVCIACSDPNVANANQGQVDYYCDPACIPSTEEHFGVNNNP